MRILFLSQVLPYPLDAGPKIRGYFVLRHLVQNHEVTLVTFVRKTDQPEHVAHLEDLCHAIHTIPIHRSLLRDIRSLGKSYFTRQPFLIIRDHIPKMAEKVRQLVRFGPFDVIHADQLWMAQYALTAKAISPISKLILDQHNAVHLIPKRLAEARGSAFVKGLLLHELHLLRAYEVDICQRFDHVVWVTEEDRRTVAALQPNAFCRRSSAVIPICNDPSQTEAGPRPVNGQRIVFLGGLHWPPNARGAMWFVKEVLPRVRAEISQAQLTVIGRNPPIALNGEGVEVTGYVADPAPYLAETGVFIVPLHAGGGMRVKILDAWSRGLPVVSTTIGAEGIEAGHEENILIADTPQGFARAVIRVLTEPALRRSLGENGRKTVLEKYSWRTVYAAWDTIYRSPN